MISLRYGAVASILLAPLSQAALTISSLSLQWTQIVGNYDPLNDQQTGQAESDIVGDATNGGFFTLFDDNGSTSDTDGTLAFRIRLDKPDGNGSTISFQRNAWVGIDADHNGSVDVFMGVDAQGSKQRLGIYAPGTGANTSPNTTTIESSTPFVTYTISTANYDYRAVNYLNDGGTTNDLTTATTGDPDYYLSFAVLFSDVVSYLSTKSINITDQSTVRYVVGTSTQSNSLNQDIGGVAGQTNSTSTWVQIGGFSPDSDASGNPPQAAPEPATGLLALLPLGAACLVRRRRQA